MKLDIEVDPPRPSGYDAWLPKVRSEVELFAGSSLAGWPL